MATDMQCNSFQEKVLRQLADEEHAKDTITVETDDFVAAKAVDETSTDPENLMPTPQAIGVTV